MVIIVMLETREQGIETWLLKGKYYTT